MYHKTPNAFEMYVFSSSFYKYMNIAFAWLIYIRMHLLPHSFMDKDVDDIVCIWQIFIVDLRVSL